MNSNGNNLIPDPERFWDTRHRTTDEWRSGGDRGLSVHSNRAFYLHRLGMILSLLDEFQLDDRLRILDAGCGKGWLTDSLTSIGHEVTGIDSSSAAIKICIENRTGVFSNTSLDRFSDPIGFNAIILLDVAFHILDDTVWHRSITNLATNLRRGGLLILSDTAVKSRTTSGNYIVYRPVTEYSSALNPLGIKKVGSRKYQFADNHNELLAFQVL